VHKGGPEATQIRRLLSRTPNGSSPHSVATWVENAQSIAEAVFGADHEIVDDLDDIWAAPSKARYRKIELNDEAIISSKRKLRKAFREVAIEQPQPNRKSGRLGTLSAWKKVSAFLGTSIAGAIYVLAAAPDAAKTISIAMPATTTPAKVNLGIFSADGRFFLLRETGVNEIRQDLRVSPSS
jgi:hypothetical protein